MTASHNICLFNPTSSPTGSYRQPFEDCPGLVIIDECNKWERLQEHLRFGNVDIVAIYLDGDPNGPDLHMVQRIAEVSPETGILGVSDDAHPDLIIAAMRAGCSQFVRWPIDQNDLRTALSRIRRVQIPVSSECQRICVIGSSGGTGASTVSSNLALELAHVTERRIALVDMDLQFGDAACAFDVVPKHTIAEVCQADVDIDRTLIETAMEDLPCKVSLMGRPQTIEEAQAVDPRAVQEMFRIMEQMYPFIVVDLPRYFSPASLATLEGADRVLVIAQLGVPYLRNASRIYEHLVELGANEEHIEVVLNRCKANYERVTPQEVEKHFGRPVFAMIPNDYKRIGASRDLGHSLMANAPNSPARLAIEKMARALAFGSEDGQPADTGNGKLRSLFARR